jgi:preprotein translocase subunit YajC
MIASIIIPIVSSVVLVATFTILLVMIISKHYHHHENAVILRDKMKINDQVHVNGCELGYFGTVTEIKDNDTIVVSITINKHDVYPVNKIS